MSRVRVVPAESSEKTSADQSSTPQVFRVTVETGIIQFSSVAGNSKSCWKSGFMGLCVAGCPEFGTSRGDKNTMFCLFQARFWLSEPQHGLESPDLASYQTS